MSAGTQPTPAARGAVLRSLAPRGSPRARCAPLEGQPCRESSPSLSLYLWGQGGSQMRGTNRGRLCQLGAQPWRARCCSLRTEHVSQRCFLAPSSLPSRSEPNNRPLWEAQNLLLRAVSHREPGAELQPGLIYFCSCSPRGQQPRRDERHHKCHLWCFGNKPICHPSCKAEQKNSS